MMFRRRSSVPPASSVMSEPLTCPAAVAYGDHLYVVIGTRRVRDLFRLRRELRCWRCDLRVPDPDPHPSKTGA